jgi:WD40 repeat protein
VYSVAFSPDGNQILSVSWDGTVKLWDIASGREIRSFLGHSKSVGYVAFSPDGHQILSGSLDGTVKLWDAASGREIRSFQGHSRSAVSSVAFSPDGNQILSVSGDSTVKLWDAASGREIRSFQGYSREVSSVAFSPDGNQILWGSGDGTVKLWDVASGREIRSFQGHSEAVISVAFSPDGNQILSGSRNIFSDFSESDGTVKLWDVASEREIRSLRVSSVAFSPDGNQILSGSWDGTVKLWDIASWREIRSFQGHSEAVTSVAFSPDGNQILSGSWDSTTRIWDVSTGKEIAQFVSFTDGEWVVLTAEGYYSASPNGDQYLNVRIGNAVYSIDQYRAAFNKPQLVALALSGNPGAYLAAIQGKETILNPALAPPQVLIRNPADGSSLNANQVQITVSVDGGTQSLQNIKVLLNGRLIARDEGVSPTGGKGMAVTARLAVLANGTSNKKQAQFTLPIPLDPGTNRIEVLAHNGYSEGRALVEVNYQTRQTFLPNLYILAVGVSRYDDPSIPSLKYAANDARGIIGAFKAQEGKRYGKVNAFLIADGADKEPTAANILDGMDFLQNAKPNDVMILFISGHGETDNQGNYFFVPKDIAFTAAGSPQRSRIIPNSALQDVLSWPGQKLVFIDSCYSAGLTGKQVSGADTYQLINSLKDNAPVVFTSSSGNQKSWEWDPGKYGLFTYVLLEGLQGKADMDKDGKIRIEELGQYLKTTVPGMKTPDIQQPYCLVPTGYKDFVVAEAR